MTRYKKSIGDIGEDFAAEFLISQKYKIIARNFRIQRAEIDIIAEIDKIIVFIEVKTRTSNKFGRPAEAVTNTKQKSIITAAMGFLQQNDLFDRACRFDVVEVFANNSDNFANWRINHIENAFELVSEF